MIILMEIDRLLYWQENWLICKTELISVLGFNEGVK